MVCTFFGHRDTPRKIEPLLRAALEQLIVSKQATVFYVGHNGNFDAMTRRLLVELKAKYPQIQYEVVLAYMPGQKNKPETDYSHTVYPEGLENVLPKFAIQKRNEWMLDRADIVLTYVTCSFGGAAQFKKLAEKKGKKVINLAV